MSKLLRSLPVLLTLFHSFSDPGMAQEGVTCDAEPTSMSIQYGDLIDCTLEIGTDRDIFRFAGILGDIVTLQIADFDSFAPTVAMIDVFDPTGSALISADGTIEFTLVKSGIHSVRVSELGNDATVPVRYSLGLDRLVPRSDFAARVCFGCSVGESLDPAGDLDLYYFTATEGDVVELAVFDPNLFEDAVAVADVFDPAGLPVANIDSAGEPGSITIQTSGDFAIRITELNRNDPMIPYELRLDCVGGPCVGQVDLCSAEATLVSDLVARGVGITRLGDPGAFSFSVGNLGGTVAQEVVATIALPQGLQLSNATPGRGSCSEVNPIRCELGALEPRPLPTLIQAQICLKFTPQTTQTPRQPIFFANPPVTPARFRVGPLLESFFNTELRFLHNPG